MQLRTYLAIVRQRWPLVVLLPLLVGILSLALALGRPPLYQATTRLMITQTPHDGVPSVLPNLNEQASWVTTEYILDDLPFVFSSAAFAEDVRQALAAEGQTVDPAKIKTAFSAEVTHRSVRVSATANDAALATALLRSAVSTLAQGGLKYWGRSTSSSLIVATLDPPDPAVRVGSTTALLREVGVRVALALAASVGLAFLANYLDDRLRTVHQAEAWTGARVLGVIPKD